MALINCPACGKPISDKAVKCPHCGKIILKTNTHTRIFGFHAKWIFAPLFVCVLWGLYFAEVFPFDSFFHHFGNNGDADTYTHIGLSVSSVILAILLVILESNQVRIAVKMLFFFVVALSLTLLAFKVEEECNPSEPYHQLAKGNYYANKNDFANAMYWYNIAAVNDNSEACYNIAWLYDDGLGVEQNYETALQWYLKVPQCKYPDVELVATAYNNIGVMYQKGNGVEKDMQKAMEFFQMALKTVEENPTMFESQNGSMIIEKIKKHINELEEASPNNLQTLDLSAFMLHGKVKSVEEYDGGQVYSTYYFSEQGKITKAKISEGSYKCKINRQANKLILSFENPDDEFGGWAYVYTVDNSGRLTSSKYGSEDFGDETTYSNFDSNGWPTRSKTIAELGGAVTISSISYPKIDEHGNWTQQSLKDDGGNVVTVYRTIKYYE